jgi:acetolactate synthase regulatory subunit
MAILKNIVLIFVLQATLIHVTYADQVTDLLLGQTKKSVTVTAKTITTKNSALDDQKICSRLEYCNTRSCIQNNHFNENEIDETKDKFEVMSPHTKQKLSKQLKKVQDVTVDRTVEDRVEAEHKENPVENLLENDAPKEI